MNDPRLFIRADAGPAMGTGHVMRCLALAQAWRKAGGEAGFLAGGLPSAIRSRLADEGFAVHDLPATHPDPADLAATLDILRRQARTGDWMALDGYQFTTDYQAACADRIQLLVVDDLAHLPAYHGHALLNQNPYAPELDYPVRGDVLLLLGQRYAMLRNEFFLVPRRPTSAANSEGVRVLVTFGGADPARACELALRGLRLAALPGLSVRLVAGPVNPGLAELRQIADRAGFPVNILSESLDMAGLMAWADLAVCAAGSTCWELAYLGVPAVVLETADNQHGVARSLAQAGVSMVLGRSAQVSPKELAAAIRSLAGDTARRRAMAKRAVAFIDGQGRTRVVEALRRVGGGRP